jgi:UDP-N-acetylglucosamine acyltransferase
MAIHPTAVIDRQAEIDSSARIGPYVVVEGPVRVGAGTNVRAHAYLSGWTQIGAACEIHPFAVVGHFPQDFHYSGERSYCKIGDRVVIREGATVHRGTQPESWTIIGDECLLMAYAHVGHNCELGKGAKIYNTVLLAGHVEVGDNAIVSGASLVHQFVRIGKLAFIAGGARVTMDVPPFFMAYGESTVVQHNVIGMRRAGHDRDAIQEVRQAFRTLYRSGHTFRRAVEQLAASVRTPAGQELVAFLQTESRRGICAAGRSSRNRLHPDSPADLGHEA